MLKFAFHNVFHKAGENEHKETTRTFRQMVAMLVFHDMKQRMSTQKRRIHNSQFIICILQTDLKNNSQDTPE